MDINKTQIEFTWVRDLSEVGASIYSSHEYQRLFGNYDGSESRLLKCKSRGQSAYLPMLIRYINNGQKEAYSAYGYGGLVGSLSMSNADVDLLKMFLAEESIIALFIRHSPFLGNQKQWPNELVELNRRTYAITLTKSKNYETYLKGISQKKRWSANYARRAGLSVVFTPLEECTPQRIYSFYELYSRLMREKQTSNYYMFSIDLFVEHGKALKKNCELAEIIDSKSGDLLGAAIFLLDTSGWVHYHLSASTTGAMKLQGMELLIITALQRYGNLGYKDLHLGGGHAFDETDGLSRFKMKFSDRKLDFCCTKLICHTERYKCERERLPLKHPSFFLIKDSRGSSSSN